MDDSANNVVFTEAEELVLLSDKELGQFVESFNSGADLILPHLQPTIEVVLMFAMAGWMSLMWLTVALTIYFGPTAASISLNIALLAILIILIFAYKSVRSHVKITQNGELKRETSVFGYNTISDIPLRTPVNAIKLELESRNYKGLNSWHTYLTATSKSEDKHELNSPVGVSVFYSGSKETAQDIAKALKTVTRFRIMGRLTAIRCQVPFIDSAYKDE